MKKLFIICLVLHYTVSAQSFSWEKLDFEDAIKTEDRIEQLADWIIPIYQNKDEADFLDILFRLQIATKEFELSNTSIDSVRILYKSLFPDYAMVMGIHYEVTNNTVLRQKKEDISYKKAFEASFHEATKSLSSAEMTYLEYFFTADVKELADNFNTLVETQNAKDSISLEDAVSLTRSFVSYSTYKAMGALPVTLVNELDNKYYSIQDSVSIPLKGGSSISAIVIREKKSADKLPTVLNFSIYPSGFSTTAAKEIAQKGYVGVIAHTRGKRYSDDETNPFEFDASDVYEVIDWISKQEWSNGEVGMYGGSYLGFTQWAAAKKLHPALKTIVPQVAVGAGIDYPQHNGVFMSYMQRWIGYVTNNKMTDDEGFRNEKKWDSIYKTWYKSGKSFRALDSISGKPNPIFQRWLDHPGFDSYWHNMAASGNDFSKIDIPVLTMTGYYDDDQIGALYYFKEHHKYHKSPNHYLLIGPYDHGGAQGFINPELQGYKLDSVANIDIDKLAFNWFDHVLKDSIKPDFLKDKVNFQIMGANQWKHVSALDKINNETLKFYLSNSKKDAFFRLTKSVLKEGEFIPYEMNFADRSNPTKGYAMDSSMILDSIVNIGDKLAFATAPFENSFELNGQFTGQLNLMLNKKDVDISIILYEIQPDGTYFNLSNYLGRASYVEDRKVRNLLLPNKKQQIPIKNSFFTSKKISKGSRLLILLSVNNSIGWQINHGSGKDVSDETVEDAKEPLQIKWYTDSYLEFPIFKE